MDAEQKAREVLRPVTEAEVPLAALIAAAVNALPALLAVAEAAGRLPADRFDEDRAAELFFALAELERAK